MFIMQRLPTVLLGVMALKILTDTLAAIDQASHPVFKA
jgi:hypothetical protein